MAFDIQNHTLIKYLEESSLSEIIIPDGITTIGEYAFCGCKNIRKVIFPESVTSIRKCAFWNCCHLESVLLPESLTFIGTRAFHCCYNLKEVTIPESVTHIDPLAFGNWMNFITLIFIRNHRKIKITLHNPWNSYTAENQLAYFIESPCFKNFSALKPEFKVPIALGYYETDEQISAYLKRGIRKAVIFAIDAGDCELLADLLKTGFITKKNIDFMIQYAIEDTQKYGEPESQIMLTNYKHEHFPSDISEISRKLRL
ncbi:MAG: leucine-rich repeat domain-containing protein [Oscillospiraceae bacterium]|nr:leucine-rich repeat domain-containing protein [Oscillospiraceae bacterium]